MLQQSHTPLANGIMSFMVAPEDHELAPIELAPIGIGSMHEQAQKLAEYGRHGDIYFVHAAEGETVVPMEVLNANPKVKNMLFNQMREMGLDPDEFVVGNELNSINPVTGMPEFFIGSVFRAVKKVVKSVVKVAKKVAPIAIPIAAAYFGVPFLDQTFFGPSSFGASFLGGGIGSLLGPDPSLGKALRAGLFAGGTAALAGGIKGLTTGKGFGAGVSKAFVNPDAVSFQPLARRFSDIGEVFSSKPGSMTAGEFLGFSNPPDAGGIAAEFDLTGGDFTGLDHSQILPAAPSVPGGAGHYLATRGGGPPIGTNLAARTPLPSVAQGPGLPQYAQVSTPSASPQAAFQQPTTSPVPGADYMGADFRGAYPAETFRAGPYARAAMGDPGSSTDWLGKAGEYYDTAKDYMFRGGDSAADVLARQTKAAEDAVAALSPGTSKAVRDAVALKAMEGAGTTMLEAYGPSLALAGGAAYLGGAFDPPEESEEDRRKREALEQQQVARRGPNPLYTAAERERELGGKNRFLIGGGDPDALNPNLFRVERATGPGPSGPFQVASQATQPVDFGRAPSYQDYMRNRFGTPFQDNPGYARYAADGGFIDGQPRYPRREMLVEGPGTERSDDIPAMLSDGEFVLNSRSVRGADPTGQGNRYRGAQNLYNMMRNFEMRG